MTRATSLGIARILGVGVTFGFPIGETQRINFGLNIEHTEIREGFAAAQEISEFIDRNVLMPELQGKPVMDSIYPESRSIRRSRVLAVRRGDHFGPRQ